MQTHNSEKNYLSLFVLIDIKLDGEGMRIKVDLNLFGFVLINVNKNVNQFRTFAIFSHFLQTVL